MNYTRTFSSLNASDVIIAGGKGASLGEMFQAGISVPDGYVILATTFEKFLHTSGLVAEIETILGTVEHEVVHTVESASEKIQALIKKVELPEGMKSEILQAFMGLDAEFVAVRSSATAEDGAEHAWAGQLDSYLNVTSSDVLEKIQHCWASLFTPRAIFYRFQKGLHTTHISVAVVVQKMVNSEVSGIAFSVHPVTEDRNQLIIEAGFGLGEAIVSGSVTPDAYVVKKLPREMIDITISEQSKGLFRKPDGGNQWIDLGEKGTQQVLSAQQITELAELIIKIEHHYGFPCDIEWAYEAGKFYIVQSRPITTLSQNKQTNCAQRNPQTDTGNILNKDLFEKPIFSELIGKKENYIKAVTRPYPLLLISELYEGLLKEDNYQIYYPNISAHISQCMVGAEIYYLSEDVKRFEKELLHFYIDEDHFYGVQKKWIDAENNLLEAAQGTDYLLYIQRIQEYSPALDVIYMQHDFFTLMHGLLLQKSDIANADSLMDILNLPLRLNYYRQEEYDLVLTDDLESHIQTYRWLSAKYGSKDAYTLEDAKAKKKNIDQAEYLQSFHFHQEKVSQAILNAKSLLGEKNEHLVELMQWLVWFRTQRTDVIARATYLFRPGYEKLAQEFDVSYDDILSMSTRETLENTLPSQAELQNRKKGYVFYIDRNKQYIFTQDECLKAQEFMREDIQDTTQIIGVTACAGHIEGRVRVIHEKSDLHKVSAGDVLVTTMTTPNMISAMKQAGAFVTDEGGITCHAAIIAREMKKPCIIGTNNATKILKDGDLVEVDAVSGIVRIIEKKHDEEWIKNVTREVTIFPAASVTKSFGRISKPFEIEFDYEHILFVGNTWYYRKSDYEKLRDILTKKIHENPNYVWHIAKKQKEVGENLKRFVQKLASIQISNKNLESFVREYDEKMTEFYAFWWIAIPVGEILEGQVRKIVENKEIDFDELMFVREELELVREKRLRNEIAVECQKYTKYEDLPKILKEKLVQHAEKFGWINTSYHVGTGLSARDFFEKIQAESPEKSIEEMYEQRKREKNTLTRLRKYVSKKDQSIIKSMQTIMYLRNYQKETVNECQFKSEIFLRKMALEIGIEWNTFLAFSATEIQEYIKHTLPKKDYLQKAKKRHKEFVIEWVDADVSVYEEGLEKYLTKVAKNEPDQVKTIQGNPAYKGKISGKVRVIHKKSDIELFIPGEILVANMTSIDYVHIMGRASAIITNEGGITCHAAIFSRELKIPCIIGTKNATKILKDGDLVEVDAEKGMVRILEKQNVITQKKLEVWIERKQGIFSMTVFHELESKIMREHLGGGFKTQICFMRNKVCSYIHEVGDFEHVVNNIAKKLQEDSQETIDKYREEMIFWETRGLEIIDEGKEKYIVSIETMREYLDDYKKIGYWTTVVPYFLLEAIHKLQDDKRYGNLKEVCEKIRSNSLYPILNQNITNSVLEMISRNMGLTNEDGYYITWDESVDLLEGKKIHNLSSIKARKDKDSAWYRGENGETVFIEDEDALQLLSQISYPTSNGKIIQGMTGYPGKVYGKVKILRTTEDMKYFEPGDILVSPNSNPSLMDCIQKCSAIITDEGGVSCHAAIISRELRKPCILGTKNATKVLKDGDLVEVDADNGVVTILERKKGVFEKVWEPAATRNMSIWSDILISQGLSVNLPKYGINSEGYFLYTVEDGTYSTLFIEAENKKHLLVAIEERCQDGPKIKSLRKIYEEFAQEALNSLEEAQNSLTLENLQIFFLNYQRIAAGLPITTFFGRTGCEKLIQGLGDVGVNDIEMPNIVSQLTYPAEHTPLFLSQLDMIEIGIIYQAGVSESELIILLETWLSKHKYIPVNFCEDSWALDDARDQLKNFLEKDCSQLKQTFQSEHDIRIIERDKLRKQYKNSMIYDLADALAQATSLNEYRKNIICRLSYGVRFIFAPLMQKVGSDNWRDAYFCTPEELINILQGEELDIKKLKKSRKKIVVTTDETGKVHWLYDDQGQVFYDQIDSKKEDVVYDTVLKGFSANRGKVVGRVKIVLSSKDFNKVERGDILVATMTSVDFVSIMERSGAFVTDEGGITSHASIVAREMNKPCVIGTKNATKVLKDGDLVEVDADNGIIRILEKN